MASIEGRRRASTGCEPDEAPERALRANDVAPARAFFTTVRRSKDELDRFLVLVASRPPTQSWGVQCGREPISDMGLRRLTTEGSMRCYGMISTGVPTGAQSYNQAATSIGKLTQPWLIGVPKLLCQ